MTEQEKIEKAAKNYLPVRFTMIDTFKAGASYYEKECMPGMMEKFAAWFNEEQWRGGKEDRSEYKQMFIKGNWGGVVKRFLSHLKHNQDAGSENKG